jgi:hypothetical protein
MATPEHHLKLIVGDLVLKLAMTQSELDTVRETTSPPPPKGGSTTATDTRKG